MFCGPLLYWPAALINRRVIALGCRFDERLSVCEDRDFLAQIAEHGDFGFVPVTGFNYRLTLGTSGTATGTTGIPSATSRTRLSCVPNGPVVACITRNALPPVAAARSPPTFAATLPAPVLHSPRFCVTILTTPTRCTVLDVSILRPVRSISHCNRWSEPLTSHRMQRSTTTLAEIVAARGDTSRARNAAACAAQDSRLREPALALPSRLPAGTATGEAPPAPPSGNGSRRAVAAAVVATRIVTASSQPGRSLRSPRQHRGLRPPAARRPGQSVKCSRPAQRWRRERQPGRWRCWTRSMPKLSSTRARPPRMARSPSMPAIAPVPANGSSARCKSIRIPEAGALLHQCSERQYAPIFAASVYREVARLRERLQPDVVAISAQSCDTVHIVADLANVGGPSVTPST